MWACHGPNTGGLPFSFSVTATVEATWDTPNGGCGSVNGFVRLGFQRDDPALGQNVSLRFNVPQGVTLGHVRLARTASGPGYVASTSAHELEREDEGQLLDEDLSAAATGDFVELRLSCSTAPRCDSPAAGVDFHAATLTVRDTTPPSATVTSPGLRRASWTSTCAERTPGLASRP